jgi:hypothetical protein
MGTLLDELPTLARSRATRAACRARVDGGGWTHATWAELDASTGRAAGSLTVARGAVVRWAAPPGPSRCALDLALLHLGVVGEAADDAGASVLDVPGAGRDDPGRLVRLRAELRATDPAALREGRRLDHAAVLRHARRAAHALEGAEDVLVTGPASLHQSVRWGALVGGFARIDGDARFATDLLAVAEPDAWVCAPADLDALALPRSRLGPVGALARGWSAPGARLGARLRRVFVRGEIPSSAAALRERGVRVDRWIVEEA